MNHTLLGNHVVIGRSALMEVESTETRQRVDRWMEEGQFLLGRVMPELLDERDRLRNRSELAEQERDKLRQELNLLQEEMNALRDENQRYRAEQMAAAQSVGTMMDHVHQVLQPMHELVQRLQGGLRAA
jgi:uncharacterized protein (DUF3084 family)